MDAVRALFEKWDKDGNGKISRAEMKQVLKELTDDFTEEQIDALFDAADSDKDGALDYQEFLDFLWDPSAKKLSPEELEALRALFNRFDTDKDGSLEKPEFMNLMQNMLPTRAGEFDVADVDSDGGIDFDEFVRYWQSVVGKPGFNAGELDEVADMFNCFDKNSSGELDREEFLNLLDNLFPGHCEENRKHVDAEFKNCDASSDNGVSFAELLAYYERLKSWYGERLGWPPLDPEEREASLSEDFVMSRCGLQFLPERLAIHHRSCAACKKIFADEQDRLQEEENKRRAQEEARMKEALRKAREEKDERLRRAQEEEEARRRAEEEARRKAQEGQKKDPNGFVPCRYCGRTFFPDRIPKHESVCPKNKGTIHGIRPTVTPGEMAPTIGRYDIPR
jgi:Ca2+-binding EF-hand superfamily protein